MVIIKVVKRSRETNIFERSSERKISLSRVQVYKTENYLKKKCQKKESLGEPFSRKDHLRKSFQDLLVKNIEYDELLVREEKHRLTAELGIISMVWVLQTCSVKK